MKGILTDVTKCIGCRECEKACAEANSLPKHIPARQHNGDGLASNKWTSIVATESGKYVRKQCRHCQEPACVSACIVGALTKTAEGAVVYDAGKCMGCRYCMMACPYAIPRYSWEDVVPYIRKCIMCSDRIKDGKEPACTEVCPEKATIFGDRDELLKEAHKRIQAEPNKYEDRVYGEHEVGGTSVLYLTSKDTPLDFLGWKKDLGTRPLPDYTWAALKYVPYEFLGMGAVMGGIWWITGRREKVAEAEGAGAEGAGADGAGADNGESIESAAGQGGEGKEE